MADHAQNQKRPNTIICIDAHHRVRSSAMNLLFVCSRNRRRSLTAEAVLSDLQGHSVLSAGTSPDANTPVSADLNNLKATVRLYYADVN